MGPTEPRNGRTIVQALLEEGWKELDTIVEHIMWEGEPQSRNTWNPDDLAAIREQFQEYGEWRGQAQGIAYMLAVLTNPYQPDIEAIRSEAMQRWEEGQ